MYYFIAMVGLFKYLIILLFNGLSFSESLLVAFKEDWVDTYKLISGCTKKSIANILESLHPAFNLYWCKSKTYIMDWFLCLKSAVLKMTTVFLKKCFVVGNIFSVFSWKVKHLC